MKIVAAIVLAGIILAILKILFGNMEWRYSKKITVSVHYS
jgi:hypothetical protein